MARVKVVIGGTKVQRDVVTRGLPLSGKVAQVVANAQSRETGALLGKERTRLGELVDSQMSNTRRAVRALKENPRCAVEDGEDQSTLGLTDEQVRASRRGH